MANNEKRGEIKGDRDNGEHEAAAWAAELCNGVEELFNPIELFYYYDQFEFSSYAETLMERLYPELWNRYHSMIEKIKKNRKFELSGKDSLDDVAMDFGAARLHIGLICGYLFALKGQGMDSKTLRRQAELAIRRIRN